MVNFREIIISSVNWTTTVLFKPFKLKKWLIFAFIAIMAGFMSTGCNFDLNNFARRYIDKGQEARASQPLITLESAAGPSSVADNRPLTREEIRIIIIIISVIILIALALLVLFAWISSRFSFVFLEAVAKNDGSIAAPFKANRELGSSYFLFNLAFYGVSLVLSVGIIYLSVIALVKTGAFNKGVTDIKQIFGLLTVILPHLLFMLVLVLSHCLISLIAANFVVAVMFKDRIGVLEAWAKVLTLLKKNIADFIVYVLINTGLYICATIAYFFTSLIYLLAVTIPIVLLGTAFYFISRYIMASYLTLYWVIIGIVSAPPVLFLFYCMMSLYLPFAVFFRTFSVKFLGRLDLRYDLIAS